MGEIEVQTGKNIMRKNRKKLLGLLIAVMLMASLTACRSTQEKITGSWELTKTEAWSGLFYKTLNLYEEGSWDYGIWELDGETLELTFLGYKQNPNIPDIIRYKVSVSGNQMTLTTHDIEGIYTKCPEDSDVTSKSNFIKP